MKGVEALPLKYIAMLIVAALIVGAVIYSTNILASISINGTNSASSSIEELLKDAMSRVLSNATP